MLNPESHSERRRNTKRPLKEGELWRLKVIPGAPERDLDHGGVVLMKLQRGGTRSWIRMNPCVLSHLQQLQHFCVFTYLGVSVLERRGGGVSPLASSLVRQGEAELLMSPSARRHYPPPHPVSL